ncbi:hypothetical protein [Jiella sp. M17.18]|uniref:hypothetical protein n=1 Tax=Jiella sp. M17.18 TaxID=3234247 RepID=UPI0034DDF0CB
MATRSDNQRHAQSRGNPRRFRMLLATVLIVLAAFFAAALFYFMTMPGGTGGPAPAISRTAPSG